MVELDGTQNSQALEQDKVEQSKVQGGPAETPKEHRKKSLKSFNDVTNVEKSSHREKPKAS